MCQRVSRWTTVATPPASSTSSAPGSQSHGSVSGWIQPSSRPAATHASSSEPGPAWRSRPAASSRRCATSRTPGLTSRSWRKNAATCASASAAALADPGRGALAAGRREQLVAPPGRRSRRPWRPASSSSATALHQPVRPRGEGDGAVDAVDPPAAVAGAGVVGALLALDRVVRAVRAQDRHRGGLGLAVGVGHEVGADALGARRAAAARARASAAAAAALAAATAIDRSD